MRFARGLVVGTFAPLHRGHQLVIETARAACDHVTVMTWANPDVPGMPTEVRAGWLRTLYPDLEVVALTAEIYPPDDAPDAVQQAFTAAHLPHPVDAVFTSEAYGDALARVLEAVHVSVDPDRRHVPISGTQIRADLSRHMTDLDPVVRAHFVQRVVFLGAESTGKSTLVDALGAATGEPTVEEVGRTLWVEAGGDLPLSEYVTICREHVALEDAAVERAKRFVFVDTNAITTQQYAFFFFGECPAEVQTYADRCRERYAWTFVCAPDIPFDQDG
ncbi:AAA family ATPase, partial [Rubrivirga sp.]|uniref:AAA family ATPase n=1 Tax=Rubrivirga sp. TaxID=1885344 RepID=UPI003C728969